MLGNQHYLIVYLIIKLKVKTFPFCTIDPNISIINVPDLRLDHLKEIVDPEKLIPTTVKIVDIAGLVKGASKGEGLRKQISLKYKRNRCYTSCFKMF